MTLEQVEGQIADFLTKARKVQMKAQHFQRQGAMAAMQSEVAIREKFNEYFEDGLTILGKGIVKRRKIKELLVAEAHRKAASLKKAESRKMKKIRLKDKHSGVHHAAAARAR